MKADSTRVPLLQAHEVFLLRRWWQGLSLACWSDGLRNGLCGRCGADVRA